MSVRFQWPDEVPILTGKDFIRGQLVNNNGLTDELCSRIQSIDVTDYSLEMQMWWRDHQEHDRQRLQKELEEKKRQADKEAALAKLTPYERKLLGIRGV